MQKACTTKTLIHVLTKQLTVHSGEVSRVLLFTHFRRYFTFLYEGFLLNRPLGRFSLKFVMSMYVFFVFFVPSSKSHFPVDCKVLVEGRICLTIKTVAFEICWTFKMVLVPYGKVLHPFPPFSG
jgi:hypothetical protein